MHWNKGAHDFKVIWKPLNKSNLINLANLESRLLSLAFEAFYDPVPLNEILATRSSISSKHISYILPIVLFLHEAFQDYTWKPWALGKVCRGGSTAGRREEEGTSSEHIPLTWYLSMKFAKVTSWPGRSQEEIVKVRFRETRSQIVVENPFPTPLFAQLSLPYC